MDRDGTIKLVAAIVRGTPSLPRAACIGHHALYDEIPARPSRDQRRERFEAAVTVCRGCPVRARVITAATFPTVAASNPAVAGRGFEALVPRTARGRLKLGGSCVPSPGGAPSERMRHFARLALDGDL